MAFFTVDTSEEMIKDSNGGSYINESGIYDVTIEKVRVNVNQHNARSLDFKINYSGNSMVLYGLKLDMNNGQPHFQRELFNKLCVIAGFESIDQPEIEATQWYDPKQRKEVLTDISCLPQFEGLPIKIRIQMEHSKYNNSIVTRREIRGFYRVEDGATANEIINGTQAGTQLEKDKRYASEDAYRDNLTKEEVEASKKRNSSTTTQATTANASAPINNPFQKK